MPSAMGERGWLRTAQNNWGFLAQAGVWILGIVGGFLLPPPVGQGEQGNEIWLRLAQFVAAVSVGLIYLPVQYWSRRKYAKWWWMVTVVFLLASIGSFFGYQHLTNSVTCQYRGRPVVIGSVYTVNGEQYVKDNPGTNCSVMIDDFVGNTEDIWTKRSIDLARLKLAATYIGCMPLFTACIVSMVQALYCATRRRI